MYHVRCRPGSAFLDAQWSCLERMGSWTLPLSPTPRFGNSRRSSWTA